MGSEMAVKRGGDWYAQRQQGKECCCCFCALTMRHRRESRARRQVRGFGGRKVRRGGRDGHTSRVEGSRIDGTTVKAVRLR